jgi:2,3-bisphosphoglycerate-dependent phosphoglycerate mutase
MLCGQVDLPLTRRGRLQAQQLCQAAMRLRRVDALYTSTLRRAIDTSRPLANELALEARRWASLREISRGVLDGLPVVEVKRAYAKLWEANLAQSDGDFGWPGGETYHDFRKRVLRAVQRIAQTHAGGRVLIVTHAGVTGTLVRFNDQRHLSSVNHPDEVRPTAATAHPRAG